MRGAHVGDPVAHRFVNGVFQGTAAGIDGDDLRAEQAHARDVQGLAGHVFRAHVDDAFEAEVRGDGGGGYAVLTCAGFCDDARLAHFHCEQSLADSVVDFVRAGVEEIFALEIDARPAEMIREPRCELERRGASGKILEQALQLRLERCVGFGDFVGALELKERDHERFGNIAAAVGAEAPGCGRWRLEDRAHKLSRIRQRRFELLFGAANFINKFVQPDVIFLSRLQFDATGDVDRVGLHNANCFRDVFDLETAG